jgi:hypothetical protein
MGACSAQVVREETSEEKENKPELEVFSITTGEGRRWRYVHSASRRGREVLRRWGEKNQGFGNGEE